MISVCMATYHGEKYRDKQINSILENLSETDEFIISDDGGDKVFLGSLQNSVFRPLQGAGKGVVANFEFALSHARGDIIFLSDQDDIWTKDKVKKTLKCFENPNCIMVVHDADLINSGDEKIGSSFFAIRNSKAGFLKNLCKNSYIGCCMVFRRELLEYALPFPTKGTLHDQWLGLLAEQMGEVVFLEDKLIHYRRHEDNVSGMQHLPVYKMLYNRIHLCCSLLKRRIRGRRTYEPYTREDVEIRWKH